MENLTTRIEEIIKKSIPAGCPVKVWERNGAFGGSYIGIMFGAKEARVDAVTNMVQCVSLSLDPKTFELDTQVYGGAGGGSIRRKPNLDDPTEKHYYCKNIKVPFRRPMPTEEAVLRAIERFALNWTKLIRENKEILMYQDLADNYSNF